MYTKQQEKKQANNYITAEKSNSSSDVQYEQKITQSNYFDRATDININNNK